MDINTYSISVTKTARYATYGQLSEKTKYFWIALHGSNMLCDQMLYKFKDFDPQTHFVVAPEGLSRFYLKGFGGDVVAAWMTSRDRLSEIEDFSNYLSQLMAHFAPHLSPACKTLGLGFSQGGTTLFRWLHHSLVKLDYVIGYSCWIPEDIKLSKSKTNLEDSRILYTYGTKDRFLTNEKIAEVNGIIGNNKMQVSMIPYDGIHKVDRGQLRLLFEDYIKDKND